MNVVEMRDGANRCLAQWIWLENVRRWSLVHVDGALDEDVARLVRAVDLERVPDPRGVSMAQRLMEYRWFLLDCDPDFERTRAGALDETTEMQYRVSRGQ